MCHTSICANSRAFVINIQPVYGLIIGKGLLLFFFRKSHKLLTERALSDLYGDGLVIKFNSSSFNFNGGYINTARAFVCFELPATESQAISVTFKSFPPHFIGFISSLLN